MDKTEQMEQEILDSLTNAWNCFVKLPQTHGDDGRDFRRAIHECQRIMATRQVRRSDPVSYSLAEDDNASTIDLSSAHRIVASWPKWKQELAKQVLRPSRRSCSPEKLGE